MLQRRNQDLMPALFNELLDWGNWENAFRSERSVTPKTNISESESDYELELCVPGLKKEDLSLSIDTDNNLVVEMVQKEEKEDRNDRRYLRREFSSLRFKQVMAMPENVKKEQISACVNHGILKITLPKLTSEEREQCAQTIEIS